MGTKTKTQIQDLKNGHMIRIIRHVAVIMVEPNNAPLFVSLKFSLPTCRLIYVLIQKYNIIIEVQELSSN